MASDTKSSKIKAVLNKRIGLNRQNKNFKAIFKENKNLQQGLNRMQSKQKKLPEAEKELETRMKCQDCQKTERVEKRRYPLAKE